MSAAPLRLLLINQSWFAPELREMGHTVYTAGWVHDGFDIRFPRLLHIQSLLAQIPQSEQIDAILYFDDSHSISLRGLESLALPTIFYSIDVHHHWRWHSWIALMFDRTLVAQRDYISVLLRTNKAVRAESLHWFPLWAPAYLEPAAEKEIDVSFRGNLDPDFQPERAKFFTELAGHVPVDVKQGPYAEVYTHSKVVVNQSVGDDLNFRVFEALMSGAALVTPRTGNGLAELFEVGRDLLTYAAGDAADAASKILPLLDDDAQRAAIAASGRKRILERHTAMLRAEQLVEHIRATKREEKPLRFMAAAMSYLHGLENFRQTFDCESDEAREYRNHLVFALRDSLILQVETGELVDDEFRALLLTCKCYLELVLTREALLDFSAQMRKRYPDDLMLNLAYIDDLIALGRVEDANRCAAEISDSASELLASLPGLIEEMRNRVLAPQKERFAKRPL